MWTLVVECEGTWVCDTICVVGPDGVLFAKNSDRDANEAQILEWHPRTAEARAVLISRPIQMWGAEMGVNEDGVAIGNEAVFTREAVPRSGLTGMDLVRHGLERGRTAAEAMAVMTRLLEECGQGGDCGYEDRSFRYFSSFIVADPKEAFVLETCGRAWASEEIRGARSISNVLTIPGFAERHSDRLRTAVAGGRERRAFTEAQAAGAGGAADLVRILRSHGDPWPRYHPVRGTLGAPCMHGGGLVANSVTTASMVCVLRPGEHRAYATGTGAPCVGLYKPVRVDEPVAIGDLWRRHERLHRAVLGNPARLAPLFTAERDAVEARWLERGAPSREAFAEGDALLARWTSRVLSEAVPDARPWWARRYWTKQATREPDGPSWT